jgi:GLPGLI family protein
MNSKFTTMKKLILVAGILVALSTVFCFAQSSEGVINYEMKVNMHRNIPKENEGMKQMIPEFRTSQQQLFFTAEESLYKPLEEDDDEEFNDGNGAQIRMRMPQSEVYVKPSDEKIIEMREFLDKKYLINDTLKAKGWKLGTGAKTILGYECKDAMRYDEERKQTVVAWFTNKLRPSLGPDRFCALPGAVLEVNVNEGERTLTAKKIDLRSLKKGELKVPEKGIAMSGAAFRKMVDEQMKKMGAQGGMIIRRN